MTSLSYSGSWTNDQYVGTTVDPTGLSFTVTKIDGTTESVSPQAHTPTTWGDTAGTQTCTFTYTDGYDSVSCEVTATVLAEELSSIAVSGTPQTPTEFGPVNATGLTVTATYNSGRTADVTSQAVFTDFVTETDHVGSVWRWDSYGGDYGIAQTRVHASYTEGGVTKEANSGEVWIAPTANGPNTAATAYELENTADNYVTLDWRGYNNVNVQTMDPFDGDQGGYLITGASSGQLVWMTFTKSQYDSDTPVDITAFSGIIPLVGAKSVPDANGPCWWDGCTASSQSWQACNAVKGANGLTLPVHLVTVVGYLNDDIAAGGEGTIKKSMFVSETKKEFWVDVVAPAAP